MKRLVELDFVRAIAILGVVSIHISDAIMSRTNYFGGISWWISVVVNCIGRIGVPLFLVVSGFLVLGTDSRKNLVSRLILPLFIWGGIYLYWHNYWFNEPITANRIFLIFIDGNLFHLYFLFIIIGLYITAPLLDKLWKNIPPHKKLPTLISLFIFGMIFVGINYFYKPPFSTITSFTYFLPFVGYFLVGNYFKDYKPSKKALVLSIIVFIASAATTIILTYLNFRNLINHNFNYWNQNGGQYFGDYLSPNVIIMSISSYVFLKELGRLITNNSKILSRIIVLVSVCSYGVYHIHPIIIDLLDHYANMAVHLITTSLAVYLTYKIFLVMSISLLTVYILKRTHLSRILFGDR